jgi:hypothetical protein
MKKLIHEITFFMTSHRNLETQKPKMETQNAAHKIQTKFIQYIYQKWRNSTQNQHRNQCINDADFLTFQPIHEIPSHALFCIQDRANPYQKETQTIWFAFHVNSFAQYIHPLPKDSVINPYTRNFFHPDDIRRFYFSLKWKGLLNQTSLHPEINQFPYLQSTYYPLPFDKRINQIIHTLNYLENEYLQGSIQSKWLTELSKPKWYQFYITMLFMWNNRLTSEIQENINSKFPYFTKKTKTPVKDSLALCENLLNYGINEEYCQMGASIVLSSIAMVNIEAKYKMPYYYDAL